MLIRVVAEERSEAAIGVVRHSDVVVVKPDFAVLQKKRAIWFYDRCALERSLVPSAAATGLGYSRRVTGMPTSSTPLASLTRF